MIYRIRVLLAITIMAISFSMAGCSSETQTTADEKIEKKTADKELKVTEEKPKMVELDTTLGSIVIELNEKAAPVTVKNFLRYTEEGYFDGTIFHRVIKNFMIQGGGFTADMKQKKPHEPIINEANNGLKNERGTITMARRPNPDSATCQFFINHKNNPGLNYMGPTRPGYAVFGKVVEGMDIVDKIASVSTTQKTGHKDVPIETVLIKSARVVSGE